MVEKVGIKRENVWSRIQQHPQRVEEQENLQHLQSQEQNQKQQNQTKQPKGLNSFTS